MQSPESSDPIARDFVPGPFNMPRLRQTFQSTIASDLMTLAYLHKPPGTPERKYGERLRSWDDSSPYHKNRPLRAPRGESVLRLIERDITFKNIPEIKSVSIASYVPKATTEPFRLIAARATIQAMTGAVPEITTTKFGVSNWKTIKGKKSGVKTTIYGNEAYEFVDKLVHLVLPRIKEWQGIKGTTGDSSGNLSFGLTPDDVALFPEIEVNYSVSPRQHRKFSIIY